MWGFRHSILITLYLSIFIHADIAPFSNCRAASDGLYGNYTRQLYLSDVNVEGPVANIIVPPQIGVSPSSHVTWSPWRVPYYRSQPMLLDARTFSTVWSGPFIGSTSLNLAVQSCNGSTYLTWWSAGRYFMMNNRYEIVYNVSTAPPITAADVHEFYLTETCTALITGYQERNETLIFGNTTHDLWKDSCFQEIDIATGDLLFQWQASEQIPDMTAEIACLGWNPDSIRAFDWFHINSVQKDHTGNYLVNSRFACTTYYISGLDGSIIWRLGGPKNDFEDLSGGDATNFRHQHHARWVNHDLTMLSLFDDQSVNPALTVKGSKRASRGIILELDHKRRQVSLYRKYDAVRSITAQHEGSMQVLLDSSNNVMLGYGEEPAWTEFAANGTVLLDVELGPPDRGDYSVANYRTLKANWTGNPYWAPKIAPGPAPNYVFNKTSEMFSIGLTDKESETPLQNDTVYFSWNGATEIKSWAVLGSNDTTQMTPSDVVIEIAKAGFEDCAFVGAQTRYATVLALDDSDAVIGATPVLTMIGFHLTDGLAGPDGNDTASLTETWRMFVSAQPDDSEFIKRRLLRDGSRRYGSSASTHDSMFPMIISASLVALLLWYVLRQRATEYWTAFRLSGNVYYPVHHRTLTTSRKSVGCIDNYEYDEDSEMTYCDERLSTSELGQVENEKSK